MLGKFSPTPVHILNYSDGKNNYYIKRDDLIPFSFGGNKVRIAQKYFEDMEEKGCNCVVTYGNARSNLCRVVANMSKAKNIPCYIISPADDSGKRINTNNCLITVGLGAKIVPCLKSEVYKTVSLVLDTCRKQGLNPYYTYGDIYGNGNESVAVQAYVEVYKEIREQEKDMRIKFDYIILACGTGMTLAGLLCGQLMFGDNREIIGISVARNKKKATETVLKYIIKYFDDEVVNIQSADLLKIVDDYLLGGYGKYNEGIIQMIIQLLSIDGIAFDPTYTGKAFWGMKNYLDNIGAYHKDILFIHTGGTPLFFDNIELINAVKKQDGQEHEQINIIV